MHAVVRRLLPSAATIAVPFTLVITLCLLHLHPLHGLSLILSPPPPVLHHLATIATRHRHDRRQPGDAIYNIIAERRNTPICRLSTYINQDNGNEGCIYSDDTFLPTTRRSFFTTSMTVASSTVFMTMATSTFSASAVEENEGGLAADINDKSRTISTADATITDKIFIEFKGLSPPITADGQNPNISNNDRIVIGLFGNDAPQPVSIIKKLVTKEGYTGSKCKPLDTSRTLIKEQLEANKVYNTCMETEDTTGVNYDYATVWRVIANERVDVGAVSGRFVARENPNFVESGSKLRHDAAGVVSVRRGNDGGFGFTIFPGGGSASGGSDVNAKAATMILDDENIVVGRILEGMDVVQRLNELPVVKQSAGSILGGGGGGGKEKTKVAPSRGCRYGGTELYCNEYKPLRKVLLDKTGVL